MVKKIISLLFVLMFASTTCAFADSIGVLNGKSINITPPDGYTVVPADAEGYVRADITCADPAAVQFSMSVCESEDFAGYTLDIHHLTEEERAQMMSKLTADFDSPEVQLYTAEDGSSVIFVDEQGAASDYAFLFTIYKGYLAEVDLFKTSGQIGAEDIELARNMLSSTRDVLIDTLGE